MKESDKIPSMDLTGRVAMVTGATKGLGYGMAMGLAQAGADIIVVSRTPADCEKVAKEIEMMGRKALSVAADVSTVKGIEKLVSYAVKEMGQIDILVNNAGIGITKKAVEVTEEEWDATLNLNLKGIFFLCQMVGKHMIERRSGSIINISSAAGLKQEVNVAPYYISKAGAIQLSKVLALEWARYNLRVNCVCPGYVMTSLNEKELSDPQILERFVKTISMRRLGTVGEIAGIVVYLASDASRYVTGAVFSVDGGLTLN
ncbi:MAG: 2-dehydro-3-deoxy-D-gluconate 5-dehydrogenase [Smithella sp. PtaU1.Bin162]|nr:MAG: 2-dehydro-3-deoxy-D-gluconate 5-dehydrogenase [Smithella sp. PtaU1.Bin162]